MKADALNEKSCTGDEDSHSTSLPHLLQLLASNEITITIKIKTENLSQILTTSVDQEHVRS